MFSCKSRKEPNIKIVFVLHIRTSDIQKRRQPSTTECEIRYYNRPDEMIKDDLPAMLLPRQTVHHEPYPRPTPFASRAQPEAFGPAAAASH